jgi:hypothetical protein
MKFLKWGAGVVLLVIVVFFAAGLLLPRKYHVEREVTISASPATIHPAVNRLAEWPAWTAWTVKRYPDMKVSFSGPEEGVGAKYQWNGESTGQGDLEILTSDPQRGITYNLAFDDGAMLSTGGLTYEPAGEETRVVWYADGDLGWSPIGRYFGLMLDGMMGPDFQTGLNNLKQLVEAKTAASDERQKEPGPSPVPAAGEQ